jgi:uncharacterized protein YwgA
MNNLIRWSIILELISNLKDIGSWCGETHIQKCTFFLEEMLGVPLELDFIMYKYGPYSFDLSDDLTAMRAYNYIDLIPQDPYGVSYCLVDEVNKLKKFYPNDVEEYSEKISIVAEYFGNKTVVELEKLATAFFIHNNKGLNTINEIAASLHEIKPHVSYKDAEKAVEEILQIKSVIVS